MNNITIPTLLEGLNHTETEIRKTTTNKTMYLIKGVLESSKGAQACPYCGIQMHIHNNYEVNLRHLSIGPYFTCVRLNKSRYICPNCRRTQMQEVPFQALNHRITVEMLNYTRDLLACGFTNKQVCEITGLGKNTVKDIDLERLKQKYTIDGTSLIRPEVTAAHLGVDEFKLHDGYKFATIIIDLDTGHILWLAHGKKKSAVYEFIDHVGLEWMDGVEAVACDMNSDYEEAFEERCPHIQCVYDFFHLKKNYNEKVISAIRKDEQRRLLEEGDVEGARSLKRSKYILTSSMETLERKDSENGRIIQKGGGLFNAPEIRRHDGYVEKYNRIMKENRLLFTAELILEKLTEAYKLDDEAAMAREISEIMELCSQSGNIHLLWFKRLLDTHFEGIIAHATYKLSSGKVEGTNQMIKNVRRQGYGYPDDEYFFLKLFDASRKEYVRNQKSHKICD